MLKAELASKFDKERHEIEKKLDDQTRKGKQLEETNNLLQERFSIMKKKLNESTDNGALETIKHTHR